MEYFEAATFWEQFSNEYIKKGTITSIFMEASFIDVLKWNLPCGVCGLFQNTFCQLFLLEDILNLRASDTSTDSAYQWLSQSDNILIISANPAETLDLHLSVFEWLAELYRANNNNTDIDNMSSDESRTVQVTILSGTQAFILDNNNEKRFRNAFDNIQELHELDNFYTYLVHELSSLVSVCQQQEFEFFIHFCPFILYACINRFVWLVPYYSKLPLFDTHRNVASKFNVLSKVTSALSLNLTEQQFNADNEFAIALSLIFQGQIPTFYALGERCKALAQSIIDNIQPEEKEQDIESLPKTTVLVIDREFDLATPTYEQDNLLDLVFNYCSRSPYSSHSTNHNDNNTLLNNRSVYPPSNDLFVDSSTLETDIKDDYDYDQYNKLSFANYELQFDSWFYTLLTSRTLTNGLDSLRQRLIETIQIENIPSDIPKKLGKVTASQLDELIKPIKHDHELINNKGTNFEVSIQLVAIVIAGLNQSRLQQRETLIGIEKVLSLNVIEMLDELNRASDNLIELEQVKNVVLPSTIQSILSDIINLIDNDKKHQGYGLLDILKLITFAYSIISRFIVVGGQMETMDKIEQSLKSRLIDLFDQHLKDDQTISKNQIVDGIANSFQSLYSMAHKRSQLESDARHFCSSSANATIDEGAYSNHIPFQPLIQTLLYSLPSKNYAKHPDLTEIKYQPKHQQQHLYGNANLLRRFLVSDAPIEPSDNHILIVYGGITFQEISLALNWAEEHGKQMTVISTHITNSQIIVNQLFALDSSLN